MSIDGAIKLLEDKFGEGIVCRLGGRSTDVQYLRSGSLVLDRCIGGGFPVGKVVELYGPEGSGKSSLAMHAVREAQGAGIECGYVDMEHAFNIDFAGGIGVDTGSLLFSQPDYGEAALEVVDGLLPMCGLIVVDSVASLVPKSELDGDMGKAQMGSHARLMSQAMRKLVPMASKHGCCVVFINQIRMKYVSFGNPETTTGGRALGFYASVRVDLRRRMGEKDKLEGGHRIEFRVVKNRCGPPFRKGMVDFYYDSGIDNVGELLGLAVVDGIIERKGNTYYYDSNKLGVGRIAAVKGLKDYYDVVLERMNGKAKKK